MTAQHERDGVFASDAIRTSDEKRQPFLDVIAEADAMVWHQLAEQHAASARAARLANLLDLSAAPLPPGVAARAVKDKHT